MGALHQGHLSLILKSNQVCDKTVVSIYVNPTQFLPKEDLDSYPSTIKKDISLLLNYQIDCLFIPSDKMMYPYGLKKLDYSNSFFHMLEGESRPGFFNGVTTIVSKLFDMIQPSHAFFGEKDFQQLCVIKKMTKDLKYPIKIIGCPIVREKDGLAMSSRNQYLNNNEFHLGSQLYKSLKKVKLLIHNGERDTKLLKSIISNYFNKNQLFNIDYISIADLYTLEEVDGIIEQDILISIAIYLSGIRLIDNISITL